jgi:hypothetical protein
MCVLIFIESEPGPLAESASYLTTGTTEIIFCGASGIPRSGSATGTAVPDRNFINEEVRKILNYGNACCFYIISLLSVWGHAVA